MARPRPVHQWAAGRTWRRSVGRQGGHAALSAVYDDLRLSCFNLSSVFLCLPPRGGGASAQAALSLTVLGCAFPASPRGRGMSSGSTSRLAGGRERRSNSAYERHRETTQTPRIARQRSGRVGQWGSAGFCEDHLALRRCLRSRRAFWCRRHATSDARLLADGS